MAAAVLVAMAPGVARAAEPVVVTAEVGELPLGSHVDYLEDPAGSLTIDDVRSAALERRWTPNKSEVPNFGFTGSAYWFRFVLDNTGSEPLARLLDIGYPPLDELLLFTAADRDSRGRASGDHLPFRAREIPHEHFLYEIQAPPGRSELFLRVRTSSSCQVPITLWSRLAFAAADHTALLEHGFYYGVMLVMLAYNLFIWLAVRDRSYLFYAAYVASFVAFQASLAGLTYEYLWPSSPRWNEHLTGLAEGALLVAITIFARVFLSLRKFMPRWNAVMASFTWFGVAVVVASFVVPYRYIGTSMVLVATFASPVAVGAGVQAWRQGQRAARFYVVAWTSFLVGASAYMFNKLGLAPRNIFTENGMQIGSLLEVVLLSFALGDRINVMRAEKEHAQRDATENLRREVARQTQELRDQATKLVELDKQKTHFFQNVSHELRTPLTLILNPLDELTREATYSRDPRIDVAIKNARRLLRLVNQLLDFQKLAAGKREMRLEPVDVSAFARSCGEYFAPACAAQGIAFRVRADGAGLVVRAEADALEKIVFNFLANALKYTPEGKAIDLFVEAAAGDVRIGVTDEGPGISVEGQARLFQLFSQVDRGRGESDLALANEGTGLGLALAKELAEAMGGSAGVESQLGKGSTFFVKLPRVDAPAVTARVTGKAMAEVAAARPSERPVAEAPASVARVGDGPRVLVVDDLADMRELIARTLGRRGYRVSLASGAREALAQASADKPDCIVTDWMMPEMSGPELISALRADPDLRAVPVVLLTAKSDEESKLAGTEIGADAFLGKPFNESELFSTVRNLVQLKEREREVERLNRHIAENVLKRYLPAPLVDDILAGRTSVDVEPETVQATILFGDLAGFTRTSAKLRAAKMARLLNEYLGKMNDVVFAHGGTIDKYMGDGIMVIFGAPVRLEAKDQVRRAAACAIAMQHAMSDLNARWTAEGLPEIKLRIGLHHGPVVVGNFGDARRSDYTAIGPTVNLASRIEGACPEGGVLASGEVYDFLPEQMAEDAGAFELKGVEGVVRCFRLVLGTPSQASLAIH